jgi:hypothetical protein
MTTALMVRPGVTVRRAPSYEPPYDDQRHPESWVGGGLQLALELSPVGPAQRGTAAARHGTVAARDGTVAREARVGASPAGRSAAVQFAHSCLEILNGYRPATHARSLSTPASSLEVTQALAQGARKLRRVLRGPAPGRPVQLAKLKRMRVCEPRAGVAEVAAVIGTATRGWAVAFRIEHHGGTWLCSTVHVL